MYRLLLRLLPRHRRAQYGDEMEEVFASSTRMASARGPLAFLRIWLREVASLVRFAGRERLGGLRPSGGRIGAELRWAWRGIRARGWRAVFVVGLFGVVLAANAVVFAAADTFVFRTVPYAEPEQLVVFQRDGGVFSGPSDYTNRDPLLEWRKHTDLFAGIHAHDRGGSIYLSTNGTTEPIRAHRVTPGMFELLGVLPEYGRPFVTADADAGAPPVVVIAHSLARRLFHEPHLALGRSLEEAPDKPVVIGVMPATFRFPTAVEQVWRPLRLAGVAYNVGVRAVARLQPGQSSQDAGGAYLSRMAMVIAALPEESARLLKRRSGDGELALSRLADFQRGEGLTAIFTILMGAAGCLLLIACANVASLELSASADRIRAGAVRSALGATRGSLLRVAVLEGALLVGAGVALAAGLTMLGVDILTAQLTTTMRDALANPLDFDPRTIAFMAAVAGLTWAITLVPVVVQISRLSVVEGLRHDPRTMPVSRSAARSRQWLMTTQVALTAMLLVGAFLFIRAYQSRIGADKGFDTRGLLTLTVGQAPDANWDNGVLTSAVLERVRALPGVQSVASASMLPPSTQAGSSGPMLINGQAWDSVDDPAGWPMVSLNTVDTSYFQTMSIVAVEGRLFDDATPLAQVVIDEKFARRYWPNGSAVGSRFRIGDTGKAGVNEFEIIGVSRSLRADRTKTQAGNDVYFGFFRRPPGSFPLSFVIRADSTDRLPMIVDTVRSLSSRLVVRGDTVEARYRRLEADNRLAAAITTGFGALAWIVAAAGVYAVMAFLVSGRRREIGIRMALGADRAGVRRMVVSTSLRVAVIGCVLGLTGAGVASRWIEARLFGLSGIDPVTYASVAALVLGTTFAATWLPARRASRIDPAITLRAE
jgi:predicted permease